jgi:hypothetical protein
MVRNPTVPPRDSRGLFAFDLALLALLSACASDRSNTDALSPDTLRDEYLRWGDVGDSELECIGEALCGSPPPVLDLLKLARIPFRASLHHHQAAWILIAVPESRADDARAYLEKHARGRENGYRPFPGMDRAAT